MYFERYRRNGQFLTFLALAGQRGSESARKSNAEERRCDIGPVVDVLLEGVRFAAWPAPVAHEPDRIDFKKQRSSATLWRGLGIKDMRFSESLPE